MRIGIVLHPYGEDKPAGLARTIFELTRALISNAPENEFVVFLKKRPLRPPEFAGTNWKIEVLGPGIFWLERLRWASEVDVCVFNTPVVPIFWRPAHSVVLALDFAYKHLPSSGWKDSLRRAVVRQYHSFSLFRSDVIIAMSEATKSDLMNFFRVPADKIHPIYWGFKRMSAVRPEPISVPENFFLFIGVMKERKNVLNVVKAFRGFLKRNSDWHLVLAGKGEGPYYESLRSYVREEALEGRVCFLGYVSEGQAAYLYRRAQALVFPSFVEGFGFPVLEAMDCGTAVITSDCSSLAELGKEGAAILVDPREPASIEEAMLATLDPERRRALIEKGYKRSREFYWEKRAPEFLRAITSTTL